MALFDPRSSGYSKDFKVTATVTSTILDPFYNVYFKCSGPILYKNELSYVFSMDTIKYIYEKVRWSLFPFTPGKSGSLLNDAVVI